MRPCLARTDRTYTFLSSQIRIVATLTAMFPTGRAAAAYHTPAPVSVLNSLANFFVRETLQMVNAREWSSLG